MTDTQNPFAGDPDYKYDPMDPLPGQKFVEFSKNGSDGDVKVKGDPSGLDVEMKSKYIFLSKVDDPAPSHHLHVGDRVIALNGKKIEKYNDLDAMRDVLENYNVIQLVVDPTMLHKWTKREETSWIQEWYFICAQDKHAINREKKLIVM